MRVSVLVLSVVALVAVVAHVAHAQPVSYQVRPVVALGAKPQLRITAAIRVSDVRIELERNDGKKFSLHQGALAKGQAVTLSLGDGAAGVASYQGTISAQAEGAARWSDALQIETTVRPPLVVGYDAEHLDLAKHELRFTLSRPAASATLTAIGEDGGELGTGRATYTKEAPRTWLAITWTQPATARVLMLKLHAESADAGVSDVELVPWSVTIDHEDVTFASDSAVIAASETAKLAASIAKIEDIAKKSEKFVKVKLYVAGHTDTVGPAAKNRTLSLERAHAIAAYLREQGITLPIAFAGYGEDVPKVSTPDNTDERANRRADYVLGPVGAPPPFKGPYAKAHATWRELGK